MSLFPADRPARRTTGGCISSDTSSAIEEVAFSYRIFYRAGRNGPVIHSTAQRGDSEKPSSGGTGWTQAHSPTSLESEFKSRSPTESPAQAGDFCVLGAGCGRLACGSSTDSREMAFGGHLRTLGPILWRIHHSVVRRRRAAGASRSARPSPAGRDAELLRSCKPSFAVTPTAPLGRWPRQ